VIADAKMTRTHLINQMLGMFAGRKALKCAVFQEMDVHGEVM
jgi:hypothetical protein